MNHVSGPDTMKPSDAIGMVLGGLLSLVGVASLGSGTEVGLAGMALLFISVCLFIPGWHYQHGTTRIVGFVGLGLAAAASVTGAVASGWFAYGCWTSEQDDFPMLGEALTAAALVFSALAAACAAVMVKKLRARRARAGAAVTLGIVAGLVSILLWYSLRMPDWYW